VARLTGSVGLSTMTEVRAARRGAGEREGDAVTWETPAFEEVKMDAEINAYQDDFDQDDHGL
jgi:coenzyme PQQ precursor peptide PqqA